MNRFRTILLLAGVLLVAAAIAGVAQPHLGRSATPTAGTVITVTGNGTVDVTPDRASFNFGVTTQAATAAEALSRNASQARAIINALKRALGDAKGKAQAIADAAGLTLGAVVKVQEGGGSVPVPLLAEAKAAGSAVPIEAGTQQIQASMTVTYSAS